MQDMADFPFWNLNGAIQHHIWIKNVDFKIDYIAVKISINTVQTHVTHNDLSIRRMRVNCSF